MAGTSDMTCQDLKRDLMVSYLGGSLPAERVADVEGHLAGCPACRERVDLYRRLTCREFIEAYLDDYLDGALSPSVVQDLERHMEICPPCVAYLNTYRTTRSLIARGERVEMPEAVRATLGRFLLERLGKRSD